MFLQEVGRLVGMGGRNLGEFPLFSLLSSQVPILSCTYLMSFLNLGDKQTLSKFHHIQTLCLTPVVSL